MFSPWTLKIIKYNRIVFYQKQEYWLGGWTGGCEGQKQAKIIAKYHGDIDLEVYAFKIMFLTRPDYHEAEKTIASMYIGNKVALQTNKLVDESQPNSEKFTYY